MTSQPKSQSSIGANKPLQIAKATIHYTDAQLADIYSRARTDYIVPMPMNAHRMREYIDHYDVDLNKSFVAIDSDDGELNGIIMLGVREDRGWITRLGVLPERRRRRVGQFLMDKALATVKDNHFRCIQLEVIKNNEPAHKMFSKYGFKETRELLVIRRAPHKLEEKLIPDKNCQITPIQSGFKNYLDEREPGASWVEETASLLNIPELSGYEIIMPGNEKGWVVFQRTALQIQHIVMNPGASSAMMRALLAQVHHANPRQDTKVENIPLGHVSWPIFEELGYVISFRRIEMILNL